MWPSSFLASRAEGGCVLMQRAVSFGVRRNNRLYLDGADEHEFRSPRSKDRFSPTNCSIS